jgi:hypothetical protein
LTNRVLRKRNTHYPLKEHRMDIIFGIVIGFVLMLAVPAFFILKWFLEPLWSKKSGRGFH